jgi:iron-sulfur cluster repair protein YtfE (RIC family)
MTMSSQPTPATVPSDTVTACLTLDHGRLDALLEEAARRVWDADWPGASRSYADFERGLERHMRDEEEIVFPLFEARTGMTDGPTAVLRAEHGQVRVSLVLMRRGLESEDAKGFEEGLSFMRSVLPEHEAQEEHVLYPTTDRLLAPAERQAVVARLERR